MTSDRILQHYETPLIELAARSRYFGQPLLRSPDRTPVRKLVEHADTFGYNNTYLGGQPTRQALLKGKVGTYKEIELTTVSDKKVREALQTNLDAAVQAEVLRLGRTAFAITALKQDEVNSNSALSYMDETRGYKLRPIGDQLRAPIVLITGDREWFHRIHD